MGIRLSAEKARGYLPQEMLGRHRVDLAHPEDRGKLRTALTRAVERDLADAESSPS